MKNQEITSSFLGAMGITLSIQDVTQIVNLILLIVSILNILWVLYTRVKEHINKKEYNKIPQDISDTIEELKNIKEENKDE
jgi:S-adenosylmethionine:tRNA-ribosyltransferase-isomerase (queuine synthetase)